jgi:RNA polymerase sigma-70 factor (ECF subfamily)
MTVPQLVQRAKTGDRDALEALYKLYSPLIFRYIAYRVPSLHDAEDITAEVFVKMVKGLPTYNPSSVPFESWLYRIAAARVIDFRRRSGRRPLSDLTENMADMTPLPEEQVQNKQMNLGLRSAMQQLSDEQQTILILRFVELKSHEEVANIVGKSIAAVKTTQYRALRRLVEILGSEKKVRHYLRGQRG